jgi:Tol biopolymer transport system component
MVRSSILAPIHTRYDFAQEKSGSLSMSPDGRHMTFSLQTPDGDTSLWIRSLDSVEARPLPGTKGGTWPFWSPDSLQVAFFADGKLKRVDLAGSPAITICDARDGRGGDWNRDGLILLAPFFNSPIFSVPASGGTPRQITQIDDQVAKETTHRWPRFLPDGRHFLYVAGTHTGGIESDSNAIHLAEIGKPGRRRLLPARSNVTYTSGHLLYVRDRVLLAQPFDPVGLEMIGDPVPIAEGLATETFFFRVLFAASESGDVVFRAGPQAADAHLTWFGRDGKEIAKLGEPGSFQQVVLSPDGRRAAYTQIEGDSAVGDIWIIDLARGVRSRLTFEPGYKIAPRWSSDGQQIVYTVAALHDDLFLRNSGGGERQDLLRSDADKQATDWSRDGRYLAYNQVDSTSSSTGVWILPLAEKDKPRPFVDAEANERDGRFSPDGRWMLYTSDESGRNQIYVAPFPGPGATWQVSTGGSSSAWWTQGGKEIVYMSPDLTFWSLAVHAAAGTFEVDPPRRLFRAPQAIGGDVTPDGQKFLIAIRSEEDEEQPVTLVTNWPAGLKR